MVDKSNYGTGSPIMDENSCLSPKVVIKGILKNRNNSEMSDGRNSINDTQLNENNNRRKNSISS